MWFLHHRIFGYCWYNQSEVRNVDHQTVGTYHQQFRSSPNLWLVVVAETKAGPNNSNNDNDMAKVWPSNKTTPGKEIRDAGKTQPCEK